MNTDLLSNRKRGALMWAVSLTIGLPVGVIRIVFGFIKGGSYIGMAIVGIIMAASGFYCMPLVWVYFGNLMYYGNLRKQIIGGIRSVTMLAENHNRSKEIMANDIKKMVQKNYLPGYVVLDNEKIVDKNAMPKKDFTALQAKRAGTLELVRCPHCNAKIEMILDVGECPYCKSLITKDMLESAASETPSDETVNETKID